MQTATFVIFSKKKLMHHILRFNLSISLSRLLKIKMSKTPSDEERPHLG